MLRKLALFCLAFSLLPITLGAWTTTEDAGMAVPDYPTTFGENMFTYNMFGVERGIQLEHSHRLLASAFGLAIVALAGGILTSESRRSVRILGILLVLGVISQGLLGGFRVQLIERGLATVHGFTASLFVATLAVTALMLSPNWRLRPEATRHHADLAATDSRRLARIRTIACLAGGLLLVQYVLGGLLRHHQLARLEHAGFAAVAWTGLVVAAVLAIRSRVRWVATAGWLVAAAATAQVALGLWTYAAKYGFGSKVAVYGSTEQIATRTGHMVLGVLLVASMAVLIARTWRSLEQVRSLAGPESDGGRRAGRTTTPPPETIEPRQIAIDVSPGTATSAAASGNPATTEALR